MTAAISSIAAGGYGMLGGATQTGVGQALFGTVAGGVTAELQGGNFWQGAAMGLTVSLLNHVAHRTGPNPRTKLSSRRFATDDNGNVVSESLNYFDPKNDADLFNRAESEPLRMNELTVYSHGSTNGFADSYNLNVGDGVSRVLYEDSAVWRNFADGKSKNLTLVIKACETGKMIPYQSNISNVLTKQFGGLTIFSPSNNWGADGRIQYHSGGTLHYGVYNKYQNGSFLYSVPNK